MLNLKKILNIFIDYKKIFINSDPLYSLYNNKYIDGIKSFSTKETWQHEANFAINLSGISDKQFGLDLGCNAGYGTFYIANKFKLKIHGIDISRVAIDTAKKKITSEFCEFSLFSGKKIAFEDNNFDFVYSFHVLGHVKNHDIFISEAFRVLKEDGVFLIITPNAYYKLIAIIDSLINCYNPDPTILKYWFPSPIISLLRKNGFKKIKYKFIGELPMLLKPLKFLSIFRSRIVMVACK